MKHWSVCYPICWSVSHLTTASEKCRDSVNNQSFRPTWNGTNYDKWNQFVSWFHFIFAIVFACKPQSTFASASKRMFRVGQWGFTLLKLTLGWRSYLRFPAYLSSLSISFMASIMVSASSRSSRARTLAPPCRTSIWALRSWSAISGTRRTVGYYITASDRIASDLHAMPYALRRCERLAMRLDTFQNKHRQFRKK